MAVSQAPERHENKRSSQKRRTMEVIKQRIAVQLARVLGLKQAVERPQARNLLEIPVGPAQKLSGQCMMDTPYGLIRSFHLVLNGCELYIYRDQRDQQFQSMHILTSAGVQMRPATYGPLVTEERD